MFLEEYELKSFKGQVSIEDEILKGDISREDLIERQPSNLVTDAELTMRFQESALKLSYLMRHRFYQVFEEMDEEDVVSECWQKIIRQKISYDPEKANFNTFVRMIVTQRLIELTRTRNRIDRIPYLISLDQTIDNRTSTSSQVTTRADLISDDTSESDFTTLEILSEIQEFTSLFNTIPKLEEIVELFVSGYSFDEVVCITGVSEGWVRCARRVMCEVRKHRREGTAKSLADIMYGESQEWELNIVKGIDGKESSEHEAIRKRDIKRKNHLTDFCCMITDVETGINLADIVRLIIRGFNYKSICKKLSCMKEDFTDVVTGEPVMVDNIDPVTSECARVKKRVLKYPNINFNENTIQHVLEKYEEILI